MRIWGTNRPDLSEETSPHNSSLNPHTPPLRGRIKESKSMTTYAPVSNLHCASVASCAELLGVSEDHVRGLIAQGKLNAYRVGKRIVVKHSDLEDLLHRNKVVV
jgi:excisionase family DNA binding protein